MLFTSHPFGSGDDPPGPQSIVFVRRRKEVPGPVMLHDLLSGKRSSIVQKWFDRILESYPENTTRLLKKEKDPFANPVRHTILQGVEGVFDELLKKGDRPKELNDYLDKVIRIRSVQDFPPSQALAFVFSLKEVIRDVLGKEIRENDLYDPLSALDRRIDALALRAFDVFMGCREEIYELRVSEVKRTREQALRLLERTDRVRQKRMEDEETP
jgi:hypothetical protein